MSGHGASAEVYMYETEQGQKVAVKQFKFSTMAKVINPFILYFFL